MSSQIHPTAIIDQKAQLGESVTVGPFSIIERNAEIGDRCQIASCSLIGENTKIGKECRIYHGAVVGTIPQDLKYHGEETFLEIGTNTIIREYCTMNRGTIANGKTIIGSNCAFLAYCHVGHDCVIGNDVISSNSLNMAGHVIVGDHVTLGGVVAVHQFCRIGDFAFVQAGVNVYKDIIPYAMLGGEVNSAKIIGINKVGLERKGIDEKRRTRIKNLFRAIFKDSLTVQEAVIKLTEEAPEDEDIKKIAAFIQGSERGIYRMD
jgi:UDP-N-acetylglucosamine acyltransferase